MSWFSKHFGITLNRDSLGNLLKDVAPAAAFTPLGVLGAGGLAALGDLGRGKNIGQALKSGVENAALGGGLASLGAKVGLGTGAHLGFGLGGGSGAAAGSAGAPGSSTAASAGSVASPAAPTAASFETAPATGGGLAGLPGVSMTPSAPSPLSFSPISSAGVHAAKLPPFATPSTGLLSSLGKGADWLEAHNHTASLGLQGLGDIQYSGINERLGNAAAARAEAEAGLSANELAQRKASQAALSPYWSGLVGMGNPRQPAAPNPYVPTGG